MNKNDFLKELLKENFTICNKWVTKGDNTFNVEYITEIVNKTLKKSKDTIK